MSYLSYYQADDYGPADVKPRLREFSNLYAQVGNDDACFALISGAADLEGSLDECRNPDVFELLQIKIHEIRIVRWESRGPVVYSTNDMENGDKVINEFRQLIVDNLNVKNWNDFKQAEESCVGHLATENVEEVFRSEMSSVFGLKNSVSK